jgi:hypothetical protein
MRNRFIFMLKKWETLPMRPTPKPALHLEGWHSVEMVSTHSWEKDLLQMCQSCEGWMSILYLFRRKQGSYFSNSGLHSVFVIKPYLISYTTGIFLCIPAEISWISLFLFCYLLSVLTWLHGFFLLLLFQVLLRTFSLQILMWHFSQVFESYLVSYFCKIAVSPLKSQQKELYLILYLW